MRSGMAGRHTGTQPASSSARLYWRSFSTWWAVILLTTMPPISRRGLVCVGHAGHQVDGGGDAAQAELARVDHDEGTVGGGEGTHGEGAEVGAAVEEDGVRSARPRRRGRWPAVRSSARVGLDAVVGGRGGTRPAAGGPGCSRPTARWRRRRRRGRGRSAARPPRRVVASGSRPRCHVAAPRGSRSTTSTCSSAAQAAEASPRATVVLPTPPFWLTRATVEPMARWWHDGAWLALGRSPHSVCERSLHVAVRSAVDGRADGQVRRPWPAAIGAGAGRWRSPGPIPGDAGSRG